MTTHYVEWTIGSQETDIGIEFKMTYAGHRGTMPSQSDPYGEPPAPPEFELVRATVLVTEEQPWPPVTIKPGHALWGALEAALDSDERLFEKMAETAQSYVNDEDC